MMTEEQKQDLAAECRRTIVDAEKPGAGYRTVARGEIARIALATLTQPASPALRLPDTFSPHDAKMFCAAHGVTGAYELASQMANYAVDKVVRLNAPHTAPIEPICATGGAEWVSDDRLSQLSKLETMHEVSSMASELLARRKAFTQPIVWIHQTTGAKLNNSVIEDARKQSGVWIPLYRKPNLPL